MNASTDKQSQKTLIASKTVQQPSTVAALMNNIKVQKSLDNYESKGVLSDVVDKANIDASSGLDRKHCQVGEVLPSEDELILSKKKPTLPISNAHIEMSRANKESISVSIESIVAQSQDPSTINSGKDKELVEEQAAIEESFTSGDEFEHVKRPKVAMASIKKPRVSSVGVIATVEAIKSRNKKCNRQLKEASSDCGSAGKK
ncbi:hypothetical protein PTKIN_Ptkin09bG0245200 [Pterospermum kingtungense]